MMLNRTRLYLALLLCLTLFLSACGSSPPASAPSDDEGTPAASDSVELSDTLIIGGLTDPANSWDPIYTSSGYWSAISSNFFEGLVYRDEDLELHPGLAESWDIAPDGMTYTFYLREGVTFHNGEPFNAEAVKFTFDRMIGPDAPSSNQRPNYDSIQEVQIVDEYTVKFIMAARDPVLLTKLSGFGGFIVPPKYIQEHGEAHFALNPVGTGPYRVVNYLLDQQIELEAYPDHWRGVPKTKNIIFRFIPEDSTRVAELKTGAVHIALRLPISLVPSVENEPGLSVQEIYGPRVTGLRLDVKRPPMDDVRVRKAINHAIDVQSIIDTVLEGHGNRVTQYGSPSATGYNHNVQPYEYDPEKAKQLLAEAGVEPGTQLDLYYMAPDSVEAELSLAVQGFLQEVGFEVKLHPTEPRTLGAELVPSGNAGHMYPWASTSWSYDYADTAVGLYTEGQLYNASFRDPKVEEWVVQLREATTTDERNAVFEELTQYLHDIAADVPLFQYSEIYGVSDKVKNFKLPLDNWMRLHEVIVEK